MAVAVGALAAAAAAAGHRGRLPVPVQARTAAGPRPLHARRPGRVPDRRHHARDARVPAPAVPPVHRAGAPIRARVPDAHGRHPVRDRQRLRVHQGGAHHQRVQVRRPTRLRPVPRAVRRRPQQL